MTWEGQFILVVVLICTFMLSGMWIPFAIGLTGIIILLTTGGVTELNALGIVVWGGMDSFILTALPLFILMAEILIVSGTSQRFYGALALLLRRLPGGLLQSNIGGCSIFAAISGSSVATAAAIGSVAIPELKKRGYDMSMATGSLAAGGTLGILIPPSGAMILYGMFTELSITQLFIAGLIPGILLSLIFMVYIAIAAIFRPSIAPRDDVPLRLRTFATAILDLLPFFTLIGAVLGSMYAGIATPTEAAAVGASVAVVIGAIWGRLDWRLLTEAISRTVSSSCTILMIVAMAFIFSYAVNNAQIASNLAATLTAMNLDRTTFLVVIYVMYALLGCIIDSIGMIMITVPLLYPTILALGIDPIWFGVILVIQVELGQITPPFGINLMVIQSIARCGMGLIIRGCVPYFALMIGFVIFLTVFPEVALWLPQRMMSKQ
jgi:C4-dicarboxylate transporter, DctM subunit